MFIKIIKKHNKGSDRIFTYHRLIQAYRTEKGPRHMTILNLGTLDIPKEQWKLLADRIEQIIHGQKPLFKIPEQIETLACHYASLINKKNLEKAPVCIDDSKQEYKNVDINSVSTSNIRTIGAENIGYSYFKKIGFEKILKSIGLSEKQIKLAALLIIGRLINPKSERGTINWANNISGLKELLNINLKKITHNAFYKVGDLLYKNKVEIEKKLSEEAKQIFSFEEKVILYDLTNTYLEGRHYKSSEITFGKSKEKRSDCRLITLGLVIDNYGFPKASDFFAGNVSEPKTLEDILNKLNVKKGSTVIIDGGIAVEENLKLLKKKGYHYICVARNKPVSFDENNNDGLICIKNEKENKIEVKLLKKNEESILFCKSRLKHEKEKAMKDAYMKRFEGGLELLKSSLKKKRGTKKYEKVIERIGRLKERSHGIHQYYDIQIEKKDGNIVTDIKYKFEKSSAAETRYSGNYYLRCSRTDLNEKEIWELYITLNGVEDSFRSLKDELGIRPIYHQIANRIKAHIFITILSYHLLNAIRFKLREKNYYIRWNTVRERLSTHVVSTISMTTKEDEKIYIRNTSKPEEFHKKIYQMLGLKENCLPKRKNIVRMKDVGTINTS